MSHPYTTTTREPHHDRTKSILKAHPDVRQLIGRNPATFLVTVGILCLQFGIAVGIRHQPWWAVLLAAYLIGAFANHCTYVLIHEYTHNLVFKKPFWNRLAAIAADTVNTFPSAMSFRTYHLKHHAYQGVRALDADMPSRWEAKLIGHTWVGKALWFLFFPVFQALRPPRLREIDFFCRWTVLNVITVFSVDALTYWLLGAKGLGYLVGSLFFSIGLHPLGARWIQEHFIIAPMQETYSYYGPINRFAMNVGYHNEHHDFPSVPWNRLPQLRAMAPEWYDTIHSHRSWTKLLWRFIFDRNLSLHSRVERTNRGGDDYNTVITSTTAS